MGIDSEKVKTMAFPIQQIRNIVDAVFSKSGYSIKNFNISFPQPLNINIVKNDKEEIILTFTNSLPKVTFKKFITFTAMVEGITLKKDGGVLRLRYLPDINFKYDESSEELFGNQYNLSDIACEINDEYEDDERRKIAFKCLHYANEWATIASQGGVVFGECDGNTRKKLKRDCKNFVLDNIKNDEELKCGSVVIAFLFFYVLLPVILKFVLEKLFKKLFN